MKITLPTSFSAPGLPELNYYQIQAVEHALSKPLCLIQGPPGTGKTITAAHIAYHLTKQLIKRKRQLLVCAPSNIAIDELAEKIYQTGLKVLRVCSKARQAQDSPQNYLTLKYQMEKDAKYKELKKNKWDMKKHAYFLEKDKIINNIIKKANIICTTCINAKDKRLGSQLFHHVLIDEATQAIEPECIVPIIHQSKQIILIGDHKQLGPVINQMEVARAGLNKSLFERLIENNVDAVRLQIQYRMHPEISKFPNQQFYDGALEDDISVLQNRNFPWPNKKKPIFFYHTEGTEETSSSGTSYFNRQEAMQIEEIVVLLKKAGVKNDDIGIITPYSGQKRYIEEWVKNIEIESVDGFQGREKNYILISCVRSNDEQIIGFLSNPRRLNVAITRAKFGLIICGNAKILARDNLWNKFLHYFHENGILVEGMLGRLQICSLKILKREENEKKQQQQQENYYKQKNVY